MTSRSVGTADLLETILAATRRIVDVRSAAEPFGDLARRAENTTPRPGALRHALSRPGVNVIAECKRRSPSRGVLRPAYDAAAIAHGYATVGACAISILTEPTFFDGSLEDLRAVRQAVDVPLLRKDFIVDEYQLLEARLAGADAILLIVAALRRDALRALLGRSRAWGLDALVEVHTGEELAIAIDAGAEIIGVNNRNLRTLQVDVGASEGLAAQMPREIVAVSESGLRTAADLAKLRGVGYRGFLIGERFMTEADPGAALARLLGEVEAA